MCNHTNDSAREGAALHARRDVLKVGAAFVAAPLVGSISSATTSAQRVPPAAPDELVSGHDGVLRRPTVAARDMDVGMADAGIQHVEQHVMWPDGSAFNLQEPCGWWRSQTSRH